MERVAAAAVAAGIGLIVALLLSDDDKQKQQKEEEARKRRLREAEMQLIDEKHRELQRQEMQKRSQARNIFKLGMEEWHAAWDLEAEDDIDNATKKFKAAQRMFARASKLDPTIAQYAQYAKLSEHKINGNAAFIEGLKLHEEGNQLKENQQYAEAMKKYLHAKLHFNNAKETGECADTWRFQDCIDLVNTSIDSLKVAIQALQNYKQKKVLQEMTQVLKKEVGTEVATHTSSVDVIFQYLRDDC